MPLVVFAADVALVGRSFSRAASTQHDDEAHAERAAATSEQVVGADRARVVAGKARPDDAAEAGAAADEAEQALRLARIEDDVGERPELADEQAAREHAPQIERDRDPLLRRSGRAPRTR